MGVGQYFFSPEKRYLFPMHRSRIAAETVGPKSEKLMPYILFRKYPEGKAPYPASAVSPFIAPVKIGYRA